MALGPVAQKQLAVVGLETALQRRPAPAPALQFAEHEFDVLAGAQQIARKVRAGTVIITEAGAANGDAIAAAAGRVVDRELGKHRVIAQVLHREVLFAPVLAAQRHLPLASLHILGLAGARDPR